jgi:glutaminyl-tRNA synthetase
MCAGEFEDGAFVLRARIDMASPNLHMRDPALYRIKRGTHYRTADTWCIYPTYDFAHCVSDAIEGVTHSLCTLEFEVHRPVYDWILEQLGFENPPRQIEFAPLNLNYTALSKRLYEPLIQSGAVSGWDDPRMPTLAGLRRRGYTAESIRALCAEVGVTKFEGTTDVGLLEHHLRQDLNPRTLRVMGVLRPLKVVLTNYPEGEGEALDAINNPEDPDAGSRKVPFSRELYIERDDFHEDPPKKFFRLAPGREVRLRYAYFITCDEVVKDADGNIVELRCHYDPETKGGDSADGRKVKATLHWVSAPHALKAEIRLYERLFADENPLLDKDRGLSESLNPDSLEVVTGYVEPSVARAGAGSRYQFERLGYFCVDSEDSTPERMVFNRTITLRDTWAKVTVGKTG